MGAPPARFLQDFQIIIYEDRGIAVFIDGGPILKITPVCIDKGKPRRAFGRALQEGKKPLKEVQVLSSRQHGYTLFVVVIFFFVEVWRVQDDKVGFLLCLRQWVIRLSSFEITGTIPVTWFYLGSDIGPVYHIRCPAVAVEGQADIGYNAAASHGIEDEISLS